MSAAGPESPAPTARGGTAGPEPRCAETLTAAQLSQQSSQHALGDGRAPSMHWETAELVLGSHRPWTGLWSGNPPGCGPVAPGGPLRR